MFASAAMDEARGLLNDVGGATFSYAVLLPFVSVANDELETQLALNGVSILKRTTAFSPISIGTYLAPIPVDILVPEEMFERQLGTTEPFLLMDERPNPPEEMASTALKYWSYVDLLIKIGPANNVGALVAREIKINYTRLITPLTSSGSVVEVNKSKTYLSLRTAGLAARFIGENPERADKLDIMARGPNLDGNGGALAEVVQLYVRNSQAFGVRRKRYSRR